MRRRNTQREQGIPATRTQHVENVLFFIFFYFKKVVRVVTRYYCNDRMITRKNNFAISYPLQPRNTATIDIPSSFRYTAITSRIAPRNFVYRRRCDNVIGYW